MAKMNASDVASLVGGGALGLFATNLGTSLVVKGAATPSEIRNRMLFAGGAAAVLGTVGAVFLGASSNFMKGTVAGVAGAGIVTLVAGVIATAAVPSLSGPRYGFYGAGTLAGFYDDAYDGLKGAYYNESNYGNLGFFDEDAYGGLGRSRGRSLRRRA